MNGVLFNHLHSTTDTVCFVQDKAVENRTILWSYSMDCRLGTSPVDYFKEARIHHSPYNLWALLPQEARDMFRAVMRIPVTAVKGIYKMMSKTHHRRAPASKME